MFIGSTSGYRLFFRRVILPVEKEICSPFVRPSGWHVKNPIETVSQPRKIPCPYCGVQGNHFPAGEFLPGQRPRPPRECKVKAQRFAFTPAKLTLTVMNPLLSPASRREEKVDAERQAMRKSGSAAPVENIPAGE
jgi:hypothetical protein